MSRIVALLLAALAAFFVSDLMVWAGSTTWYIGPRMGGWALLLAANVLMVWPGEVERG